MVRLAPPVSSLTRRFSRALIGVLAGSAAAVALAGDGAVMDSLVVVGTDWPGLKGQHLFVKPILEGASLNGMTFMGKRFAMEDIASGKGAILMQVKTIAGDKRIFKIKQGWPKNAKNKGENPEMDSAHNKLGPDGGFVTLSYLEQGGVFSDEYRHLPLEVRCDAGACKLFLENGSPVDRLFAYKASNDRGIREIRPVSRGTYATLTGTIVPVGSAEVAQRDSKGELGNSASGSDNGNGERSVGSIRAN